MDTRNLGYVLREARKFKKLLQKHVARECKTNQQRVSKIERGLAQLTPLERPEFARVLDVPLSTLEELSLTPDEPRGRLIEQLCGRRPEFRHPRDRETSVRLAALKSDQPAAYRDLYRQLKSRSDWAPTRRFVTNVLTDSQFEVQAWMTLLLYRLRPLRISPLRANFRSLPVVSPDDRRCVGDCVVPALYGEIHGCPVIILPQQTVLTRTGTLRPDALVGVRVGTQTHWCAIEFDGSFKELEEDDQRADWLRMPVVRFPCKSIRAADFAETFWKKVFAALGITPRV